MPLCPGSPLQPLGAFEIVSDAPSRPAHPRIGLMVFQVDTGGWYQWTGSKWAVVRFNRPAADIQVFSAGGIWTKPAGATMVGYVLIGGGAGGGSGGVGPQATGEPRVFGGSGGGAGARLVGFVPAIMLGPTEPVGIGAAGTAGVNSHSIKSNADGIDGTDGGSTVFGAALEARGGVRGMGGPRFTNTASIAYRAYSQSGAGMQAIGGFSPQRSSLGIGGGAGYAVTVSGYMDGGFASDGPGGGGGGEGAPSSSRPPGVGGATALLAGGVAANGSTSGAGNGRSADQRTGLGGSGGGGGSYGFYGGGAGGFPGGGGGGGGAGANGYGAPNGGDGAGGLAIIYAVF